MRKWGIVVSALYAAIVLGLLVPVGVFVTGGDHSTWPGFVIGAADTYREWSALIPIIIVISGQILLLFLSIDTSFRRRKPRAHVLVSTVVAALLLTLLLFAVTLSLGVGFAGDKFFAPIDQHPWAGNTILAACAILWLLWGIIFYRYARSSSDPVGRAVSWLLAGSVLELLVVVPCHVIVRRRHDCSAPAVTSFGIVTGIAIMLLSFGPSVLFLHKKRLDAYAARSST